jgi:hypothetical protein
MYREVTICTNSDLELGTIDVYPPLPHTQTKYIVFNITFGDHSGGSRIGESYKNGFFDI